MSKGYSLAELNLKATLATALMALVVVGVAHAETWYLMAADEKALSEPNAGSVMSKGSTIGPVRFAARGDFSSRNQCESDRHKLVDDWRKQTIITRGGWTQQGITSPSVFAQCVSDSDPRLMKAPSGTNVRGPTMDVLLYARHRRAR